jgi:hypothetical protein
VVPGGWSPDIRTRGDVDGTTLVAFVFGTNGGIYQNVAVNGSTATGWSGWQPLLG